MSEEFVRPWMYSFPLGAFAFFRALFTESGFLMSMQLFMRTDLRPSAKGTRVDVVIA